MLPVGPMQIKIYIFFTQGESIIQKIKHEVIQVISLVKFGKKSIACIKFINPLIPLTNSVDPDQTSQAAASDQGLHCLHELQKILCHNMRK